MMLELFYCASVMYGLVTSYVQLKKNCKLVKNQKFFNQLEDPCKGKNHNKNVLIDNFLLESTSNDESYDCHDLCKNENDLDNNVKLEGDVDLATDDYENFYIFTILLAEEIFDKIKDQLNNEEQQIFIDCLYFDMHIDPYKLYNIIIANLNKKKTQALLKNLHSLDEDFEEAMKMIRSFDV